MAKRSIDPAMVAEMRRLRGLNKSFKDIATELNRQGFRNGKGGEINVNNLAVLFVKTQDMAVDEVAHGGIAKEDLIQAVLQGPLQADVKIGLISKIQSGDITELNYKKIDVPKEGGRILERGNLANPAAKVDLVIPGERMKERCKLIVHFFDDIKRIADS